MTSSDSTVHQRRLVSALKRGEERAFEQFVRMPPALVIESDGRDIVPDSEMKKFVP